MCNTTYRLEKSLLKPEGSKVRCSKCRHVYIVHPPFEHDEFKQPVKFAEELKFQSERRIQDNKAHKEMVEFSDDKESRSSLAEMASPLEPKDVNQSNIVSDIPVTEDESAQPTKNIELGFDEDFKGANSPDNIEDDSEPKEKGWAELPDISHIEEMIDNDDLPASKKDSDNNDYNDENA